MNGIQSLLVIFEQCCLYFPLVLGSYISISLMKLPDLSIEVAYLSGAIFATKMFMFAHVISPYLLLPLLLLVSFIGGMMVGLVSSSLSRYAHIPHLLASILTVGVFHGINQLILGSSMVSLHQKANPLASVALVKQHPELFLLLLITLAIVFAGYFLLKKQVSFCWAVFGNNPAFFEHYRISTNFVVLTGVMCANGLAGVSGYLVAQSSGFIDINVGHGMALFCLTALILGKTGILSRSFISLGVPLVGTVIYFFIVQCLLHIGFNQKFFTMIQAIFVLVILIYRSIDKKHSQIIDHLGV